MIVIIALPSFTVQMTSFKQNWFAKCLAEEGSVYTQMAMVSACLHLYTCQVDNFDLLDPYMAVVIACKPYNQWTGQILYFVDHFNE